MKILITGATGFIGSHLAELINSQGHQVRVLLRETSNQQWIKHLPLEYAYCDFFNTALLRKAVEGVDMVYHLAGLTKARTKDEYYRGNHLATKNLLEAVSDANRSIKRFVHVSSQAAVGPSLNGKAVDEQTPFHPITTYGISKMLAEQECLKMMDVFPMTITRPPAVYGPRDKDVLEFFQSMNRGLQPMIGFNNKQVSLVYVEDLVDGIMRAGTNPAGVGQTYFIASERYYTWKEVGEVTARIMGKRVMRIRIPETGVYTIAGVSECFGRLSRKPVLLNWEKARDIVQDAWTCDISKAMKELGYREQFGLEKGIGKTVQWYRDQGWLR